MVVFGLFFCLRKMSAPLNKVMSWFIINNVINNNIITKCISSAAVMNCRNMSIKAQKLEFKEFGDPDKVLNLVESTCEQPLKDQVVVKFLLAPVNPADINTIQGVYPVKPKLPGVPGNEGVGEIIAVGPETKELQIGDRVICNSQPASTWRTHSLVNENDLIKVPKDIGLVEAAGLTSNPSTAYRMLKDFVKLAPGEPVIQNGGNSAVGQNVIQLAAAWGLVSVNVVRDRPDLPALKDHLTQLGANFVVTDVELEKQRDFFEKHSLKKPLLAMNCVGGKSALSLIRTLRNDGVMVTYGGMSRDPVNVPTSAFIFKNIALHGFWMTRWHKDNRNTDAQKNMYKELFDLIKQGKLKAPLHKTIPLSQYKEAISNTMNVKGFAGFKYYIDFTS